MSPIERARAVLEGHLRVRSAWLFGSRATGKQRPESDFDLGILTDRSLTLDEFLDLQGSLQDAVGSDRVDLVELNHASPVLRFEAVRGCNLVCRDAQLQAAFVSLACRQHQEVLRTLARYRAWHTDSR